MTSRCFVVSGSNMLKTILIRSMWISNSLTSYVMSEIHYKLVCYIEGFYERVLLDDSSFFVFQGNYIYIGCHDVCLYSIWASVTHMLTYEMTLPYLLGGHPRKILGLKSCFWFTQLL